jgi:hypothetical protein
LDELRAKYGPRFGLQPFFSDKPSAPKAADIEAQLRRAIGDEAFDALPDAPGRRTLTTLMRDTNGEP